MIYISLLIVFHMISLCNNCADILSCSYRMLTIFGRAIWNFMFITVCILFLNLRKMLILYRFLLY
jgi:hypothetical protein